MSTLLNKVLILFLSAVLLISCKEPVSTSAPGTVDATFDQSAETDAILSNIENETSCFFHRDYECWKAHFAHVDYAFQAWNNADGTFSAEVGWGAIEGTAGQYLKDNPVPPDGSSHPKVERRNMQIKFFNSTLAYLSWDQYNINPALDKYTHSKETRIMEKIKGVWRIVNVTSYWDYVNLIPVDSLK